MKLKRLNERIRLFDRLQYCIPRLYKILFIDETAVSNTDHKQRCWSLPKSPIQINPPAQSAKNHTAIVAIDEAGLVHYKLIPGWANA